MGRRLALAVLGTVLVPGIWAAGRGDDGPDGPVVDDPAATTTPTTIGPGRVGVVLVDDDEETPDLTWDIDLSAATGAAQSGLCGPSGSFHLAVVDRTATPWRGLQLSTVSTWTGPGSTAATGELLPAEGEPVELTGTMTTRVDGDVVVGALDLRDDGGTTWTGTFRCGP